MDIQIKLEMFEGPLDLLLHLIEKAEVDIYEIPIAKITEQYMQVIKEAQEWQLEVASEFLVMAATLLAIKSRMLLPKQDILDEEQIGAEEEWFIDPREELVDRLLEYKRYKRLGEVLKEKEIERSKVYTRAPMDLSPYTKEVNPVYGLTVDDLFQALVEVLKTQKRAEPITKVEREEISVSARMDEIDRQLRLEGKLIFSKLLCWDEVNKERVITTFLAILELMKLKRVICYQDQLFGEIFIESFQVEEEREAIGS
ncbi:segregation and condensation protein A [Thermoflavimicrobium daqui]|uniref:Segregation and condensation protein A n=1 Tax=Thermoflavimicrobium daqui TaxID=2137476 RepID=A0A364K866_9BACL|nr:segregation/condensation protein A [Thermoflavimicrobium daqui]RAL26496.1 segregation/condensation protein A [Thermoflavimicrobium daqui]